MGSPTGSRVTALGVALLVAVGVLSPPVASAGPAGGLVTLGARGWQVQSTALATEPGDQVSSPSYDPSGWLPVRPDDAGAPGTEINALLQNGECPNVFYSDTMRDCFGYVTKRGPVTVPRFAVPWWFRTDFRLATRQHAKLIIPGVVGEGDVWVNGTLVAGRDVVSGAYAAHTFDVTSLVHPGRNSLAIKMYPNNPKEMYTLSHLDWSQIPPDNDTGIQFPVQLRLSDALSGSNAHVVQTGNATLTVKLDVTNDSTTTQRGEVTATITPPDGQDPIVLRTDVRVPAASTTAVSFDPITIHRPRLWWPYSMGDQPLYTLRTTVSQHGTVSTSDTATFGIRTITSRLVGGSPQAPDGARIFSVNGKDFVFRGGGYMPDLFLRYSRDEVARQITLIKSMGLNGIRLEGHDMPQDFYEQFDRAGLMVLGGFLCCDGWEPGSEDGLTERDFRIMHESARGIGERERNHPSVITYGWSDNKPLPRQESETLAGFADADFQVPVVASAEYKKTDTLGPAGEKEGPYDWVPPTYWYDTTHFDPGDSSRTNAGGSWAFASEQSAGHTIPTLASLQRFLSPEEQDRLWQDPEYNQYHANYSAGHGGYHFGTLYTFDTALANRYGTWSDLPTYVRLAQLANYENVRSQFEAFIDHSTDPVNPSTGLVYWQLNKGWPTLLWSLFNHDGDQPGAFYGAQKANKPLHALLSYDDDAVTVDNLGAHTESGLTLRATVRDLSGAVLDDQHVSGISLASQQVRNDVLKPVLPADGPVYFVELTLSRHGTVVDRNVYWCSTTPDVVDWPATLGNPQATMTRYADLGALRTLPRTQVDVRASSRHGTTSVTVTNTSDTVAFFLRADVQDVPWATWNENDITLWPGQSQTITATYRPGDLHGNRPVVTVSGVNTDPVTA